MDHAAGFALAQPVAALMANGHGQRAGDLFCDFKIVRPHRTDMPAERPRELTAAASMDCPSVSVIVVSWNALPLLRQCLPSVARTAYPNLEIILADNASEDGSAAWAESTFPGMKVLRLPANLLFAGGNNAAWKHARGKYVVLLNNDVETPPGWLGPLVALAESDASVAAVQPKILDFSDRNRFEYAGAAGGFLDALGYPFARGRIVDHLEADTGQHDDVRELDWACGAALLLRRTAAEEVGLLDERFEMHMEEVDLCWRLRSAGYRVLAQPASRVFHVGGGSLDSDSSRKLYLNYRNNLVMLYKNLSASRWRRVFPLRVLLDASSALVLLCRGKPRHALAVLHAYRDAHAMARHCEHRGGALPSYAGSILADRYLFGRRTFSRLPAQRFRCRLPQPVHGPDQPYIPGNGPAGEKEGHVGQ